jgi:quercetin dioxygenase-like cupin family protein
MIRRLVILGACAACFGAGALWAQQAQSTTRREPQFENPHVKVWKSIILPNQPLALHRHEHGRALIALKGGQLHVVDKDRKPIHTYDWQSGKAYWLDADPPGEMHGDLNEGKEPIEVIVVELQKDK